MLPELLFGMLLAGGVQDDVCLLRIHPTHPKKPLWVETYQPSTVPGQVYAEMLASDTRFEKLLGRKQVRFAFAAQWDGDGAEELVVIRERGRKNRTLDLRVYRLPDQIGGNTGGVVARSRRGALGPARGPGSVVCAGPIDSDGDGVDELLLVRESEDGQQSLQVFTLPRGRNASLEGPLRSDSTFGHSERDANVSLFGADLLTGPGEEIVALRRGGGLPDRLLVFRIPDAQGEAGEPLLSDLDLTPADGGRNLGMARLRYGEVEGPRPLLLREAPDGSQRLELFGYPGGPNGDVGTAAASHLNMKVGSVPIDAFAAFGVHVPRPPAWKEFEGFWHLSYRVEFQDAGGTIHSSWIGPFTGFRGEVRNESELILHFPPGTTGGNVSLGGYVSDWSSGGRFESVGAWWFTNTIMFRSTISSGMVIPGDRILVTYPTGIISNPENGPPTIRGGNPLGFSIGEVTDPTRGRLKAAVMEYQFGK